MDFSWVNGSMGQWVNGSMGQWVKMIASILGSFFKLRKGIQKIYHIIIEVIPTIQDLSLDPPSIFGSLHRTVQPDRPCCGSAQAGDTSGEVDLPAKVLRFAPAGNVRIS